MSIGSGLPKFRVASWVLSASLGTALAGSGPREMLEYSVKARFLKVFPDFIYWKEGSRTLRKEVPFTFGVLGDSPFEGYLDAEMSRGSLLGKSIRIQYLKEPRQLERFDLLFICASEVPQLAQILESLQGQAVVTVGDTPGMLEKGCMLNMVTHQDRVQIEVNLAAFRKEGLQVNSHLLRIAQKVIQ